MEYKFSLKKKDSSGRCFDVDEPWGCDAKWKVSQSEKGSYNVISLLGGTYSNQIHRDGKQNSAFQGLEGGGKRSHDS